MNDRTHRHGVATCLAVLFALALLGSGCGSTHVVRSSVQAGVAPSTAPPAPTEQQPTAQPATSAPAAVMQESVPEPVRKPLVVERVHGLGSARQAIVVTSGSWNSDVATLQTFEKDAGSWRKVDGPVDVFVGVNGFTRDKREGDGRTPAGVYSFGIMFGTSPNPVVKFAYRQATQRDVWVDDPASPLYNTWQQDPPKGRWSSAERLYQPGPYRYAAVITYNTGRVAGKGSAIFMHVSLGHGTAGCVAVSETVLVRLLRWLDPGRSPVIAMGPDVLSP